MSVVFATFIAAMLLSAAGSAESIKWTGIVNNGQWDTANNWYPAQVPGPQDDVTIDNGAVTITSAVSVNSITMGAKTTHTANLTVDAALTVATTLTVDANGNLILASGAAMVSGTVQIAGTLDWSVGTASGTWTVSTGGSATLSGQGEKTFSGCGFSAAGPVSATGLVVLNQSSQVTVTGTLTASGSFSVQAQDSTAVMLDTSAGTLAYTGGGNFAIQAPAKIGTFNLQGGGVEIYDTVTFTTSLHVPTDVFIQTQAMAVVTFLGDVTGGGLIEPGSASVTFGRVNLTGQGSVEVVSGTVYFTSPASMSSMSTLGGTTVALAPISVINWQLTAGTLNGNSTFTVVTPNIQSANGIEVNASIVVTGNATVNGSPSSSTIITFGVNGKLTFAQGSTFLNYAPTQVVGPPGSPIVNHGVITANDALSLQNVNLSGTGSVVVSDTFHVSTATIGQSLIALNSFGVFKGTATDITNIAQISGSPAVTGTIDGVSLTCGSACKNVKTTGSTAKFNFAIGN